MTQKLFKVQVEGMSLITRPKGDSSLEVVVTQDETAEFNDLARAELENRVDSFGKSLVEESKRLEKRQRDPNEPAQVTSTIVRDADIQLRRGYRKHSSSWINKGAKTVAPMGGIAVGVMADPTSITASNGYFIAFVVVLGVTILATVAAIFLE